MQITDQLVKEENLVVNASKSNEIRGAKSHPQFTQTPRLIPATLDPSHLKRRTHMPSHESMPHTQTGTEHLTRKDIHNMPDEANVFQIASLGCHFLRPFFLHRSKQIWAWQQHFHFVQLRRTRTGRVYSSQGDKSGLSQGYPHTRVICVSSQPLPASF